MSERNPMLSRHNGWIALELSKDRTAILRHVDCPHTLIMDSDTREKCRYIVTSFLYGRHPLYFLAYKLYITIFLSLIKNIFLSNFTILIYVYISSHLHTKFIILFNHPTHPTFFSLWRELWKEFLQPCIRVWEGTGRGKATSSWTVQKRHGGARCSSVQPAAGGGGDSGGLGWRLSLKYLHPKSSLFGYAMRTWKWCWVWPTPGWLIVVTEEDPALVMAAGLLRLGLVRLKSMTREWSSRSTNHWWWRKVSWCLVTQGSLTLQLFVNGEREVKRKGGNFNSRILYYFHHKLMMKGGRSRI